MPVFLVCIGALVLVGVSPFLLDAYSVNVLTRSLLYACVH